MVRLFRVIAAIEGVTTLALFLFAMPLKYFFNQPDYVPPIGLAHGIAFFAYIAGMLLLLRNAGFTGKDWTRTTLAAFFPFGTILNDPFLKRRQTLAAGASARDA